MFELYNFIKYFQNMLGMLELNVDEMERFLWVVTDNMCENKLQIIYISLIVTHNSGQNISHYIIIPFIIPFIMLLGNVGYSGNFRIGIEPD